MSMNKKATKVVCKKCSENIKEKLNKPFLTLVTGPEKKQ